MNDVRCRNPNCPDYGDPDFGEATCPQEHADEPPIGTHADGSLAYPENPMPLNVTPLPRPGLDD